MKKLLLPLMLLLSLLLASCVPTSPIQSDEPTMPEITSPEQNNEATENLQLTKDMVIDSEGNIVLDENGHLNDRALMENLNEFSSEELIKIFVYGDGAYTTGICSTLGRRVFDGSDSVTAALAKAEAAKDNGSMEMLAFLIGFELNGILNAESVTYEDFVSSFSTDSLPLREQELANIILESAAQG